jgi:hypothetical protein
VRLVECFSWFDVILCFLAVYKANCGSLKEDQDWVYDDLASTSNWLQQRDPKVSYSFHILVGLNTAEIHSDRALKYYQFYWFNSESCVLQPEPEELEFTAAQGIMVCFEDTIKCIQNNQVSGGVSLYVCIMSVDQNSLRDFP